MTKKEKKGILRWLIIGFSFSVGFWTLWAMGSGAISGQNGAIILVLALIGLGAIRVDKAWGINFGDNSDDCDDRE